MAKKIKIVVLISCPSDVEVERDIVYEVCEEISADNENYKDIILSAIHWKNDVRPIMTKKTSQEEIDAQFAKLKPDIYIGIMWKKYGERKIEGVSPTEHEFNIAYNNYIKFSRPQCMFIFSENSPSFPDQKEAEQLLEVAQFKNKLIQQYNKLVGTTKTNDEFKIMINKNLRYLLDNWNKATGVPISVPKTKPPKVKGYIEQRVYPFKRKRSEDIDFLAHQRSLTIYDLVNRERNIILLGDAGVGKTTALKQIEMINSDTSTPLYPYFLSLNTYTNQRIEELLPDELSEIPDNQILLLFDGLDEIESSNKFTAIRNIELFAEKRPKVRFIISCRTNFYKSPSGLSKGTIEGFTPYQLLSLKRKDVKQFIKKVVGNESENLINIALDLKVFDLLLIPFYLFQTLMYYKKDVDKFSNKSEFLEKIFNSIMFADIDHFRTTFDLEDAEMEIYNLLKRLAIGMESLGRNYITKEEYESLILDKEDRNLLKYSSAWKNKLEDIDIWKFEHNNLQEYLAAKVLSELALDKLKVFISFGPEYNKINPTWVNTLSFLFSILPKESKFLSEILEWMKDIEPELLVKFERDKVDLRWRIERFIEIFNSYKEKKIWINRDKYRYSELAKFGESDDIFDFLLIEIESNTHPIVLSNAIELLMYMDLSESFKKRTAKALTKLAISSESEEKIKFIALMAIAELHVFNDKSIIEIMTSLKSYKSDYVRAGLYHLLKISNSIDTYIEILIDGFKLISSNIMSPGRKSRLLDEVIQLNAVIIKIKNPNSLEKIVKYFRDNPNQISDIFDEKTYENFIQKTIEIEVESKSAIDSILLLLGILVDQHLTTMVEQTLKFFDDTNSRFSSFKRTYLNRENLENSDLILGALADYGALRYLINEYDKSSFGDDDIIRFRVGLSWFNQKYFKIFDDLIASKLGDKFTLPVQKDYKKEREERLISDINLLFHKKEFIKKLNFIFKNENKRSFKRNELFNLGAHSNEEQIYSRLIVNLLKDYSGEVEISQENALEIVNRLNWDDFAIGKLYNYHEHKSELKILPGQVEFIKNWCFSKLETTDFTKAISKHEDGNVRINTTANLMWFFMHKYKFEFPEDILLDMLSFDSVSQYGFKGIGYIEKRVSEEKVKSRILKNLREGIHTYPVMKNHLGYCRKKKLKDAVKYALDVIKDEEWWEDIRRLALDSIIDIENSLEKVERVLQDIADDFKWTVVKILIENGSNEIEDSLFVSLKEENDIGKYQSSIHLMRLGSIEGLRYFVGWTNDKMQYHEDHFIGSPIANINSPDAISLLIELLEIGHMKELKDDEFYPLRAATMNSLTNIALKSEENFNKVTIAVKSFIDKNLIKYPNVKFMNLDLEKMEQKYYINKSEKITLDEVNERLAHIF